MIKTDLELIIESIAYHQLHLQKLYEEAKDYTTKVKLIMKHEDLSSISKCIIKELDNCVEESD